MKKDKIEIKSYFNTGDKPTQEQYHDTWDSFWHKDEVLPQNNTVGSSVNAYGNVEIPLEFTHEFGALNITRSYNDKARLNNISVDNYRKFIINPVEKYVDAINGSNSNDGNSWNTAYKSFQVAEATNPDRVYLKGGYNYGTLLSNLNNDIEIITVGSKSNLFYGVSGEQRTWTDQTTGVWSNVLTGDVQNIFDYNDHDIYGGLVPYIKATDLSTCQNNPGSWFKDGNTNTIYVHTKDGLTVSNNKYALVINNISINTTAEYIYTEKINILGGLSSYSALQAYRVFKDTDFCYSALVNGLLVSGPYIKAYLENSRAYNNHLDGFNYRENAQIIEMGCSAFNNGFSNSGINNGSTGHDTAKIVRINGIYHGNEGPQVHDVNDSQSLNIDCIAYNSISTVPNNKSAFASSAGGASESSILWLDGCANKDDGTFGVEIRSSQAAVRVRNSKLNNIESGSVITTY